MSKKYRSVGYAKTKPTGIFSTPPVYVKPPYAHAGLPLLSADDVPDTTLMQTLWRAVRSRRAENSMSEARFVAWLVNRCAVSMIDNAGNIHVDLRTQPSHRTLFTAHTDTVHRNGGTNNVRLDASDPQAIRWRADEGACLGADDGAGIALMMHMMEAGVKAYYIFFRGEEHGGVGSGWLAENMPDALKDIDRCISLDRAGYSDVITHQGARCCSDVFGQALADALTSFDNNMLYMPDDTGVFTDSANLTGIVPECTNLSVGYRSQHGDGEWQDVSFLQRMAAQLVTIDWDSLPTVRDPRVTEYKSYKGVYTDTSLDWVNAPLTRHIQLLDEPEQRLADALWEATGGYYSMLRDIVAEHLLPEDVDTAKRHILCSKLSATMYASYVEGLESGEYDYETLLDILGEDLQSS